MRVLGGALVRIVPRAVGLGLAVVTFAGLVGVGQSAPATATPDDGCADVVFIGVRGSGQTSSDYSGFGRETDEVRRGTASRALNATTVQWWYASTLHPDTVTTIDLPVGTAPGA